MILSEMAGAAIEMTDALLINPNDTEEIKQAICRALEMPEQEQLKRLQHMQKIISVQTVNKWAADFVSEWSDTCRKNEQLRKKRISAGIIGAIKMKYNQAKQRLILLDYDGTLASLKTRPENAKPTPELIATLQKLVSDPANHVVVNSGRDHFTLENGWEIYLLQWLRNMVLSIRKMASGTKHKQSGMEFRIGVHLEAFCRKDASFPP